MMKQISFWLALAAAGAGAMPVMPTGLVDLEVAHDFNINVAGLTPEESAVKEVQDYSSTLYKVLDGVNDVKKLLVKDQEKDMSERVVGDEFDKISVTNVMLRNAIEELVEKADGNIPLTIQEPLDLLYEHLGRATTEGVASSAEAKEQFRSEAGRKQRRLNMERNAEGEWRRLNMEGGAGGEKGPSFSSFKTGIKDHPKYRDNARLQRHIKFHDYLQKGDISFMDHMLDHISEPTVGHGRNLAEQNEENCKKMVTCIEEYTLFDFVAFFYGKYTDDDGKIDIKKIAPADAKDMWGKLARIKDALKDVKDGQFVQNKCQTLLQEFHQNKQESTWNNTHYEEFHGATWRGVCTGQGSTKYIKLEDIKKVAGNRVALQIFEEMAQCASNMNDDPKGQDNDVFFDLYDRPRLPLGAPNSDTQDKYGQPKFPVQMYQYYQYNYVAMMDFKSRFTTESYDKMESKPNWALIDKSFVGCFQDVDKAYHDFLIKNPFKITNPTLERKYPQLKFNCKPGSGENFYCTVNVGGREVSSRCNDMNIKDSDWNYPSTLQYYKEEGTFYYDYKGLFEGDKYDLDKSASFVLGDKTSVGLVCAFAKVKKNTPGYCCMDQPWERGGDNFGTPYTCREGKDQCGHEAPGVAGFSKETCDIYSGTWCSYPVDCSILTGCVSQEIEWAEENKKHTYKTYLEAAPKPEDTTSVAECGKLNEYFGFAKNYPDQEEICEDMSYLRYDTNFEDLDKNYVDKTARIDDGGSDMAELTQPKKPSLNHDYYNNQVINIHNLGISILTGEKLYDLLDMAECPDTPFRMPFTGFDFGKVICQVVRFIAMVIAYIALWTQEQVTDVLDYLYGQDQISDHQMYEIYENTKSVYSNLDVINKNLEKVKNSVQSRRLGVQELAEGELPQLFVPPSLAWEENNLPGTQASDNVFKAEQEAINFLHKALIEAQDPGIHLDITLGSVGHCSGRFDVLPILEHEGSKHIGEASQFLLHMDTNPPEVSCGFLGSPVTGDGKTLLVSEDSTINNVLMDSGFFYSIEDDCSKSIAVQVTVDSNELDEERSVLLAKAKVAGAGPQAKVFVAPTRCGSQNRTTNSFCHGSPLVEERVYSIQVSATDAVGLVASETCQIIVMPRGDNGAAVIRDLNGKKSIRGASGDYVTELVARSSNAENYEVGSLSLL